MNDCGHSHEQHELHGCPDIGMPPLSQDKTAMMLGLVPTYGIDNRQIGGIVNPMTTTRTKPGYDLRYDHQDIGEKRLWHIEAVRTSGAREVLASATGYDGGDYWRFYICSGGNLGAKVDNRVLAEQWLMFLAELMTTGPRP